MYRILTLPLLIISLFSFGQQKYPNTLLWRISGKGLKPSYLYGTMHLTDKRIFNFGDSVYQAIEKSDGLAIELNPDEMGAYLVNEIIEQAEGKKLSELLNKKDFNKYSAALSKKFKKSADEITTRDIVKEKNKWLSEFLEKGEMPTFVDAWLYNFARRQGKWVGGVEDMADQSGLMDELVDKSDIDYMLDADTTVKKSTDRMINSMVDMYINQDLDGILKMTNSGSAESRDLLLIKRNVKMARRIDSLLALRTMFVAVGAAHLPGDSGVIDLLKARGFKVDPVFSSKQINAQQYPIKEVPIPWQTIEDQQKLYKVSMPGNPATVKLFNVVEMKFLLDITNLSGYCTMAMVHTETQTNKDSLIYRIASRMLKKNVVKSPKKITSNGLDGLEYVQLQNGENVRMQAFVRGKVVYLAFMYALKKDQVASADADKFFASFAVNQPSSQLATGYRFTDSVMGISFIAPAALTYNKKLSHDNQNSWKISCWNGSDMESGSYIMLFSKELVAGNQLLSDSLVQAELLQNMSTKCVSVEKKDTLIHGHKAMQMTGENSEQAGIFMRTLSIIDHNRNILFLIVSDSAHLNNAANERMFASLNFISPEVTWRTNTTPDGACTAWTPSHFRFHNDEDTYSFVSYDTTTATSYTIIADTMSKYTWYDSDSSFWKTNIDLVTGADTLLSLKDVQNGTVKGKEILLTSKLGTGEYKRMRFFLKDTIVYKLIMSGKKDLIAHPHTDRFFTGFKMITPSVAPDFAFTSKATLVLTDLASQDSTKRMEAYRVMDQVAWSLKDTALIRRSLFNHYLAPYVNEPGTDINNELATLLTSIGDTAAIDYIKVQYPLLTGKKAVFRNAALMLLSKIKTSKSYSTMAELIKQQAPVEQVHYEITGAMRDSLALTATIYPVLQQLLTDSTHATGISNLVLTLRDSGFITQQQIMAAEPAILKTARLVLKGLIKQDEADYRATHLIKLIGSFKTPAANKVLQSWLGVKDRWLKENTVKELLRNKQPVPATVLLALAKDEDIRTVLYEDLKELKKTSLFPKQYLTQAHFAASAIRSAATDDYDPKKISFLATKTAVYKEKKYLFYIYKVTYEGGEEYLGIAGGYVPGGNALEPKIYLHGVYWEQSFDASLVNEYVKEYLKNQDAE